MALGTGILLLAIGAILAFALHVSITGVSLVTVGYILMAAGVVGILLDLFLFAPRRRVGRRVVSEQVAPATSATTGTAGTYPASRTYSEQRVEY